MHCRREREFKVTIKFAAKKDLHFLKQFLSGKNPDMPQETIQALDVVLRQSASVEYGFILVFSSVSIVAIIVCIISHEFDCNHNLWIAAVK